MNLGQKKVDSKIICQQNIMLQDTKNFMRAGEMQQEEKVNQGVYLSWLVNLVKDSGGFSVVQLDQKSARLVEKTKKDEINNVKVVMSLQNKGNFIQIHCSVQLNHQELWCLNSNMRELLRTLNEKETCQNLAVKFYYDHALKLVTAQTFLNGGMASTIDRHMLHQKFTLIINEMQQNLRQFENSLLQRKKKLEIKVISDLNKLKQIFQQNRIARQKSTKISLLSKNSTEIVDKVVMKYLEEMKKNPQIARELYAGYKRTKMSKQHTDNMKKLNQLAESRKLKDSSQTTENAEDKFIYSFVVKSISLESQIFIENLEPGGFGQVQKYKCSYMELVTCCVDSQNKIQEYWDQQNVKIQKKYATEILVRKTPIKSEHGLTSFRKQLNCLSYLRNQQCPQIAQYFNPVNLLEEEEKNAVQQFREAQFLFSKYYERGLWDYNKGNSELKLKILADLAEGLRFLTKFNVVHRDLKPENIKVDHQGKIKIIDFGSASLNYSKQKSYSRFCFSPSYTLQYAHAHLYNMSEQQYCHHVLYDLYAYGKIIENWFDHNKGDSEFLVNSLKYLQDKCKESNPEDRLHPTQVLVFVQTLLKLYTRKGTK